MKSVLSSVLFSLWLIEPGGPLSTRTLICCRTRRWEGHFGMIAAVKGPG